ncbi:MAG: hypothetical protein JWQ84_20 [Mucilaginibacter sp.]|jgi:hypothetical protein|nr:hypothetical protein [Mucilaginibacter sp.]MDB5015188.1 hypothetical protein [Mucilaginibacter sp.]MDB5138917.1 hypothetical protein [Mucilaginibacter sp.]
MKSINEDAARKHDRDMDNPTKPFANSEKASAIEVHRAGDDKSRNYMNREGKESRGPNWDRMSKSSDGDTTVNAGVFK